MGSLSLERTGREKARTGKTVNASPARGGGSETEIFSYQERVTPSLNLMAGWQRETNRYKDHIAGRGLRLA